MVARARTRHAVEPNPGLSSVGGSTCSKWRKLAAPLRRKSTSPRSRNSVGNCSTHSGCSARRRFPLIVLFGGVDGGGKTEGVQLLNEWMDPRGIVNRAFDDPSEDERERPPFWRYWLALPPRGRIGLS